MNRQHLLLIAVVVLVLGNVAYRVWASWGLISVNATDLPAAEVIRSIEKQGRVAIRTNLGADKKVTMHVTKVPLAHAIDVLANVSDARWELTYFLAPDKGAIASALGTISNGDKPQGWKRYHVPLPPGGLPGTGEEGTSDPRRDRWEVQPASEPTLHAYLEQAAKNVSAALSAPEDWNPQISSAAKPGEIQDVMPRLAKVAGGKLEQVFLLTASRRREGSDGPPTEGGEGRRWSGLGRPSPEGEAAMARRMQEMGERMQAEIAKLPDDQRAKAQAEFEDGKRFFETMRNLSPEERRAKMEERMQDPATQERFFNNMGKREAMKTPQQRSERYRDYVQQKQGATN